MKYSLQVIARITIMIFCMALHAMPSHAQTQTATIDGVTYQLYNNIGGASAAGAVGADKNVKVADIKERVLIEGNYYPTVIVSLSGFGVADDLTEINIPATVKTVYYGGMRDVTAINLNRINVDKGNPNYKSVDGILYDKTGSSLICVPWGRTHIDIPSTITTIGYGAISGCSRITSVSLPSSVTTICDNAFAYCPSLKSVSLSKNITVLGTNVFFGSNSLESVECEKRETTIQDGKAVYYSEDGILYCLYEEGMTPKLVYYPEGRRDQTFVINRPTDINDGALVNPYIKNVVIEDDMLVCNAWTWKNPFRSLVSLENIEAKGGSSLVSRGGILFCGDDIVAFPAGKNVDNYTVEAGIGIMNYAFAGNGFIKRINLISKDDGIRSNSFDGCANLKFIICEADWRPGINQDYNSYNFFKSLNKDIIVYVNESRYDVVKSRFKGEVRLISQLHELSVCDVKRELTRISFSLLNTSDGNAKISNITVYYYDNYPNRRTIEANHEGRYVVDKLKPTMDKNGNGYEIYVSYDVDNGSGEPLHKEYCEVLYTMPVSLTFSGVKPTQTSVWVRVNASADDSCSPWLSVNNERVNDNNEVFIDGLAPGERREVNVTANYKGTIFNVSGTVSAASMGVKASVVKVGVTMAELQGSFVEGDATVLAYGFSETGKVEELDGQNTKVLQGLEPATVYYAYYGVKTKEGGTYWAQQFRKEPGDRWSTTYGNIRFETAALTWETPGATATSQSSARMMVETNCDAETGTGFEWRRIDAPDLIPSTQAPCPVVDGRLVGSLRNLNPETYYKFRPYYTSASGKTYYGAWTGLFTGDANVYFEPEVRTFGESLTDKRTVRLAGYALAGSDDITEQGFQYRAVGKAQGKARAAETWQSVAAKGIRMEATLDGLAYGTTYRYRAYAVTAKGTFYGDEREFTTEAESGIEDVINDTEEGLTVALRENPATGTAWVRVTGTDAAEARYRLTSVSGATVATGTLAADGTWQPVELTVPAGLYLLTVNDATAARTVRLIVR